MKATYGCVCFAVPKNLLRHLADKSGGAHRQLLLDQIDHASDLRSSRAATAAAGSAKPQRGTKPLHRQVFDAQGQTRLPGAVLRHEDGKPSHDEAANQVYDNLGIALEFFSKVLGRDSADGAGMRIDASVHYGFGFANAMWTGEQMIVGDGDGQHTKNIAGSLGIICHELSHALSQHLIEGGLGAVLAPDQPPRLEGEAGALNESFSDICASMVKQWHAGQDVTQADWLLGEDILAAHVGHAVRSLKDPGNRKLTWAEDDQIKDYRQFKPAQDPHTASGVGNHAFYLAATELGGRSWETLGTVWLKGYQKLHARSTYPEAARATIQVAAQVHGEGSKPHQAVRAGWKAVHVAV
jgi:Zn-dependent metalloprotease